MRRILVDFGRALRAQKRGGVRPVHLEESAALGSGRSADVVALDEALEKLAATDPRKSQIVENFGSSVDSPSTKRLRC